MIRRTGLALACALVLAHGGRVIAIQTAKSPSGHWVGSIAGPNITLEIDLDAREGDVWHGTISIPAQGTKGVPLADVSVKGNAVSFVIKGAPGDPRFAGTLSEDGKNINGDFTQGGTSMPLSLARTGDAKFEVPQKSTPITKEVEGSWEGALDVQGSTLRLLLKLTNAAGGATATLTSLDQGNVEIPVATVTQDGTRVKLIVSMISGTFDGELKGGELAGTWTQGPLSAPLVFKRTTR